jgi:hypothetical protein
MVPKPPRVLDTPDMVSYRVQNASFTTFKCSECSMKCCQELRYALSILHPCFIGLLADARDEEYDPRALFPLAFPSSLVSSQFPC